MFVGIKPVWGVWVLICILLMCGVEGGVQYLGHDISSLPLLESQGITYHNEDGKTAPLEDILKAAGMNAVRSRIWVNPQGGTYNLDYNLKLAERVKKAGLAFYLDFHYSDNWADPGKQVTPAGWPSDLAGLLKTVYSYTENVTASFKSRGISVDLVSIGNEIKNGLLWPLGKAPNYDNIAQLLKQASAGVKAGFSGSTVPKIMIHIDNGWSWSDQQYFYDNTLKNNFFTLQDFDIQGVSFYPFYGTSATIKNLNSTLNQMSNKYKKDVMVVETDWPYACPGGPALSENYPLNAEGQVEWVKAIIKTVEEVAGNRGKGVFYWEPAWFTSPNLGSGCQDAVLFNASGKVGTARSSINMFKGV